MTPCANPDLCGKPRHQRGQAPKGWVKAHIASQPAAWFCGPDCAYLALTSQPPPALPPAARPTEPLAPRHDIATCVLCINRHDRGHRCPICNTAPQLVPQRPTPATRLYDNARRGMDLLRKDPA